MSVQVNFYLGPAYGLSGRSLIITRMDRAGDVLPISAYDTQSIGGTTETATALLPRNTIWQAVLQDTKTTGEVGRKQVLNFHTGELQFPGPACDPRESLFRVLSMEDNSSSSSSSSASSSSSSSLSSSSSPSSNSSSSSSSASSSSSSSSSTS